MGWLGVRHLHRYTIHFDTTSIKRLILFISTSASTATDLRRITWSTPYPVLLETEAFG
jgi:hypothetical protein